MMVYAWLGAIIAFAVIEALTTQLVSIWFAGGAVAAFIGSICGASILTQWILFIAFSALLLICTKPLVRKLTSKGPEKTNTDAQLGKTTLVTGTIDNIAQTGEVKLSGVSWSARSIDGSIIKAGETVVVERVEGVKLIVKRQDKSDN